jgi:hypothetical protein
MFNVVAEAFDDARPKWLTAIKRRNDEARIK